VTTPLLTTVAGRPSPSIRTLTIPTEQLPSRTSTEGPEVFACGIPGVTCEQDPTPESTSASTEVETGDPSPAP
jgi:hypothetical protein